MSTRATITVADGSDRFDIYQHHDGYPDGPHGLVRHLAAAPRLAWDLPRFEAADFAAAVIAVLKERGGSTYLTKDADAHTDRSFHYRIEPLRDSVSTRVHLTISSPSHVAGQPDDTVFKGTLTDAVSRFNAVRETSSQPREVLMLGDIETALGRAEEEIRHWSKDTPDPDTQNTLEELEDAARMMSQLRRHLEQNDPWQTLEQVKHALKRLRDAQKPCPPRALPTVPISLAMDAHRRFQRD